MSPFRKILFPVDFSARCSAILPVVTGIAREFAAGLTLLHVVDPAGPGPLDAALARRRREFEKFLAGTPGRLGIRTAVVPGKPPATIVHYANTHNFDLIVFPPGDRHDNPGPLKTAVLRSARCAVWTGNGPIEAIDPGPDRFSFWTEWQLQDTR